MTRTAAQQIDFPLNIWDRVELLVGEGDEQGIYVSRIEDVNSEGIVIVKPDFVTGNRLLTANCIVYVQFLKPDALYRFSARLRQLTDGGNGQILLHSLGGIERVQRRQFVRVDMYHELKYAHLKRPSSGAMTENLEWHDSFTSNVSAGGLLMKIDDEVKKSDLLLTKIGRYEEMGIPRLVAVYVCRLLIIDKAPFAGVEFVLDRRLSWHFTNKEIEKLPPQAKKFSSNVQTHLVKYIFDQQIKERQKGLI